ncbi:MAG: V-type ATP synthase subunit E, partial [Acidimicrobiia bacterium]
MALDEILETIRAEADEAAAVIMATAQEQARQVLERATAKADDERRKSSGALDDRARLERSRIVSRAHMETARERRAAREKVYQQILDSVRRRLTEVRASPDYGEILRSLLDEATAVLPNPEAVVVDPRDVGIAEGLLASRGLQLRIETSETPLGGVKVIAGGRDVDNTLATRLLRADPRLRFVAGELLS